MSEKEQPNGRVATKGEGPVERIEERVEEILREEQEGRVWWTPFAAIGMVGGVIAVIFVVVLLGALLAYYLTF